MNIAADLRDPNYDDGTNSWINLIFSVPGSICTPDFEGYKLDHFSRKKKGLVIMIAVPETVALGKGIPQFVVTSLTTSARLAAARFKLKRIDFSFVEAEQLVTKSEPV